MRVGRANKELRRTVILLRYIASRLCGAISSMIIFKNVFAIGAFAYD